MEGFPKIPRFLKNPGGWIDFEIHFSDDLVHCARYRRLGKLYIDCVRSVRINAKLRQENTSIAGLPPFPPKIVFINHQKLERRRALLEEWLQAISSLPQTSCIYQQYANFVSECKAKSSSCVEKKEIQVFFLDGSFVSIVTNGKRLAESVSKALNFPPNLCRKFAIYLQINTSTSWQLHKKLRSFDNALDYLKPRTRLCFTRDFFCPSIDYELGQFEEGFRFLFNEAKHNYLSGTLIPRTQLDDDYFKRFLGEQKEENFLELAKCQPYYGCFTFGPLLCSLPNEETKCILTIGDFKVRIRIFLHNALEATISIRHIAYTSVSTDSMSLKLHLKQDFPKVSSIIFTTSDAQLISSMISSMLDPF
ncbi:Oidioi.mRNA.OKI2018_I69.chr1.g2804.t1.cds [Oikopleura dioica]|uniref:Oidioi.mRNA.OKI2018_I69.chr1.g2804.t1.cds n=1 Tax=Oikopleura dioica TaxID=34765 RepID=A0ABN7SXM7_OIKDI|nr:Oidioi.mRNA.OKI2018_I69.chr1.g2804.t1.cds [Oikopleura dioica]